MVALFAGHPTSAVSQALAFGRDPYGFLEDARSRFGDTFTLQLPGDPLRVVTCDPGFIKQILTLRPESYRSDRQSIHLNLGSGSLLFLDGERHRIARKVLYPVLHGEELKATGPTISFLAREQVGRLIKGQRFFLHSQMQELTLSVILESVFGAVDPARRERLRRYTLAWLDGVLSPPMQIAALALTSNRLRRFLDWATEGLRKGRRLSAIAGSLAQVPFAGQNAAKALLLDELLDDLHELRNQTGGGPNRTDVLARLVVAEKGGQAGGETERIDVDEEILDQLVTLLVGGHETTAGTLTWVFDHLLRPENREALVRAKEEAAKATEPLEANEFPYLAACIRESMRLCPIAPAVARELTMDVTLADGKFDGKTIPKGTILWPCIYLVQRRADLFPEPTVFRPERFLTASPAASHFLPWGGGQRRCIGAGFSEWEMQLILARILRRVELALDPEIAGRPTKAGFRGITIVPEHRVPVTVTKVL